MKYFKDGLQLSKCSLQNWRTLAKGVAEASGGFLGMFEESSEEAHLVGLKMIEFGNNKEPSKQNFERIDKFATL
ncbi:MAG: hypothetical protein IPP53_06170 [Bacteroidetes bacterium]|nr:hypothetical protein [Bacteroidota bacterium]